jgi:flagellar motor protein MotB
MFCRHLRLPARPSRTALGEDALMTAASDNLDESGEGYFASVSDLMVGILFVFLLMLTVFALNFRDDQDKQRAALSDLLAARAEAAREKEAAAVQRGKNEELRRLLRRAVVRMTEEVEGRQAALQRLLSNLERRLRDDGMTVIIDPESGTLRLPEQLLFDKGQSELGVVSGRSRQLCAETAAVGNLDFLRPNSSNIRSESDRLVRG